MPAEPTIAAGQNQHQPSRGITTISLISKIGSMPSQNQHQPSRGITTIVDGQLTDDANRPESTSTQSRDYNQSHQDYSPFPTGARININPVEGLQLPVYNIVSQISLCQNQHQPSRGITTVTCEDLLSRKCGQNQHQPSRGITTCAVGGR